MKAYDQDPRYVSREPRCPSCGFEWEYAVDGKTYSKVLAVYSREVDRTIAWACPACNKQWERGAILTGENTDG